MAVYYIHCFHAWVEAAVRHIYGDSAERVVGVTEYCSITDGKREE